MPVIDLRDDEDLQMERDAHEGKSLGADVDLLVAELIQIGRTDGYLSEVWKPDRDTGKNGNFNGQYKHPRAREIGEDLYKRGGMHLMEAAYYRVRAALPREARSLEIAFGGIGSWLS